MPPRLPFVCRPAVLRYAEFPHNNFITFDDGGITTLERQNSTFGANLSSNDKAVYYDSIPQPKRKEIVDSPEEELNYPQAPTIPMNTINTGFDGMESRKNTNQQNR
jgi:hypothetical protein